jgi:hypothetical protein
MTRTKFIVGCLCIASLSFSLYGCGGSSSKAEKEATGSLLRSYTLVDDQGRKSGTLTLNPLGGAELRDAEGKVIGTFAPGGAAPVTAEPAATESPEKKE